MNRRIGCPGCIVVYLLLFCYTMAQGAEKDSDTTARILPFGDSWSMFMANGALSAALNDKELHRFGLLVAGTVRAGSGVEEWAENRDRGEGALQATVEQLQQNPTVDVALFNLGFDIIFGRWKAIKDFDPPITQEEYTVFEAGVWHDLKYGADGQHGLKKIFDAILAVRPDVKILYSSYDYVGSVLEAWDMATVHKYNVGMERYTAAVIEFINAEYRNPPRVFLVNNLGLCQYTWGYPGPDPESIPSYFWPPPGTPHAFRFGPGPASEAGEPPLYPGNGTSGYVPLAGGDPDFRISPYIAQLDPPISGWVHLSPAGYRVVADHCIDEYMASWFQFPKVYGVRRAGADPTGGSEVTFEVIFSEPVANVDLPDFDALMQDGVVDARVEDVAQGKDGVTWLVTVSTGLGNGTLGLAVLDRDTIVDNDGHPLGGTGTNNGGFAYGESYHVDRSISLPLRTGPVVAALFAVAARAIRRRHIGHKTPPHDQQRTRRQIRQ